MMEWWLDNWFFWPHVVEKRRESNVIHVDFRRRKRKA